MSRAVRYAIAAVVAAGAGALWVRAVRELSALSPASAKVVDIVTLSDSTTSASSGGFDVYGFVLPDGRAVQARDEVGGAGGAGVGEVTTIYYHPADSPRFPAHYDPAQRNVPTVRGSRRSLFLIPGAATLLAIPIFLIALLPRRRRTTGGRPNVR